MFDTIYDKIDLSNERKFDKSMLFETIPIGIYITDVFHCGKLSLDGLISSNLQIDNNKFTFDKYKEQFCTQFSIYENSFMPYHYVIEIVNGNLVIYSTRPISHKSLLDNNENYITVALLTDVTQDSFPNYYYEQLSDFINSLRFIRGFSKKLKYNVVFDKSFNKSNFQINLITQRLVS